MNMNMNMKLKTKIVNMKKYGVANIVIKHIKLKNNVNYMKSILILVIKLIIIILIMFVIDVEEKVITLHNVTLQNI